MPPSAWHDQSDDAGHDEMQIAVYRAWSKSIGNPSRAITRKRYSDEVTLVPAFMVVEYPIVSRESGSVLGFADIAIQFRGDHKNERLESWILLELKPAVRSVGGLIRQCRAIEVAAESSPISPNYWDPAKTKTCLSVDVRAVVYEDDPKLELFRQLDFPVIPFARGG